MRRFETRYHAYHLAITATGPVARGFASTVPNALCAAVRRVFTKQDGPHGVCIIRDRELEIDLLIVRRGSDGLRAEFTTEAREFMGTKLRKVV